MPFGTWKCRSAIVSSPDDPAPPTNFCQGGPSGGACAHRSFAPEFHHRSSQCSKDNITVDTRFEVHLSELSHLGLSTFRWHQHAVQKVGICIGNDSNNWATELWVWTIKQKPQSPKSTVFRILNGECGLIPTGLRGDGCQLDFALRCTSDWVLDGRIWFNWRHQMSKQTHEISNALVSCSQGYFRGVLSWMKQLVDPYPFIFIFIEQYSLGKMDFSKNKEQGDKKILNMNVSLFLIYIFQEIFHSIFLKYI